MFFSDPEPIYPFWTCRPKMSGNPWYKVCSRFTGATYDGNKADNRRRGGHSLCGTRCLCEPIFCHSWPRSPVGFCGASWCRQDADISECGCPIPSRRDRIGGSTKGAAEGHRKRNTGGHATGAGGTKCLRSLILQRLPHSFQKARPIPVERSRQMARFLAQREIRSEADAEGRFVAGVAT